MKYLFFLIILYPLLHSQSLDKTLQQIQKKHDVVGMSIIISYKEKVIFEGYYGQRDIEQKLAVDHNTHFRIASVSKMISAVALMQLLEKKLFSLEDNINDYLGYKVINPHFPKQKITFKQILSHTSGLRDADAFTSFLQTSGNLNVQELLCDNGKYFSPKLFDDKNPPGYFKYANINYGIIASLVEKISNKRFDLYCCENIFSPLGITGSFNLNDITNVSDIAVLYRYINNKWQAQADNYCGKAPDLHIPKNYKLGDNGFLFAPQGGLRISARQLAKFLIDHYNNSTILSSQTTVSMHNPVWKYNGKNGDAYYGIFNTYALGNHTTKKLLPKEILIGHPGEAYGLISDMYFCPQKKYGIIFITNGGKKWQSGMRSGWYAVEEQIFGACHEFIEKYYGSK